MLLRPGASRPMPELVAMIQTTWPKIRVALYRRSDGRYEFLEEGLRSDSSGAEAWEPHSEPEICNDLDQARSAMIQHYCSATEDEFAVEPQSVTILEAPDFRGPHHPVLKPRA